MTKEEAWLYAASWGSYMSSGDPGACMYGFDERFCVQSEGHRADCLEHLNGCRAYVVITPDDYEPDELEKLDALAEKLKAAPLEATL